MADRKRYHHGDLRRALLDAALEIVRQQGLSGLTMRAVARKAKVSHMAAYHHFADKAGLVAAVAEEGFRALHEEILERAGRYPGEALSQFREAGIAYVVFAVRNPNLFKVMFGPEAADSSTHPELEKAAKGTFTAVLGLVERSQRSEGTLGVDAERIRMTAWALLHGLAMLCIDGQLGPEATEPEHAEELAYQATAAYYRGLGSGAPGADANSPEV
ncbi:MAG: TetR/AcrR family transcriptional regulator [Gemmatimonadota bacterium]|nr:MAG: TetR/AcrR family transcriptional regulator [Gemmatimonadota bacterium]